VSEIEADPRAISAGRGDFSRRAVDCAAAPPAAAMAIEAKVATSSR
jgi:hypothetical protein